MSLDANSQSRGSSRLGLQSSAILAQESGVAQSVSEKLAGWSRTLEPDLRDFARRRWAELIAAAVTAGVMLYLLFLFTRHPLPPGTDAGQWLTISRYYLGEHVPVGRTVSTVPPVVPLMLAGLSVVLPDSTLAIVVLAAACYAALAWIAFLLGRRMTGDAGGGLLAVVFVVVAQGDLFDFFSMGAYPQLVGVIGMSVCLLGLLHVSESEANSRGWILLAGGTLVTVFSHTPSATVLLPVLASCVGYLCWRSKTRGRTARAAALALVPVLIAWSGFLLLNGSSVFGYANVAAAYDLKGPDKLFQSIWNDPNERIMYAGALVAIVALFVSGRDGAERSPRRMMLAGWLLAIVALIVASALLHTNTDYPRFGAYLIVPMGVAAAAAVHGLVRSKTVVAAVAICVVVLAGQHSMHAFDKATAFYGMNEKGSELTAVSDWLNSSGEAGAITGGTREVKWLEALTGRDSLLYLPRIYITRPWEVDNAIAAEVIQRASAGVETGRFFATVNDGGQDSGKVFPVGLRVDIFHKGIYTNAFGLNDRDVRLELASYGGSQEVTLAGAARPVTVTYSDGGAQHLLTYYALDKQKAQVVRDVSADSSLPRTLQVDYYIGTLNGVTPASLSISITRPEATAVSATDGGSTFDARVFDGTAVPIDMTTGWERLNAPPRLGDPNLVWRRISVRLQVNGSERRIDDTRLYDETALLSSYGVRYIIDRDGDGAAFPFIRDRNLAPIYANDQYKVYDIAKP